MRVILQIAQVMGYTTSIIIIYILILLGVMQLIKRHDKD